MTKRLFLILTFVFILSFKTYADIPEILIKPKNFAVFHYWNQKTDYTPWYNSVKLIDKKDFLQNSNFLNNFLRI